MLLQKGSINSYTTDPTNQDISIASYNTSGAGNQRGEFVVSSGTSTISAQAQATAFSKDGLGISSMTLKETTTDLTLYKGDGSVDYYSGFQNFNYSPSTYPTALMYSLDSNGSLYFGIRIPGGQNSIQFFYGSSTTTTTNLASFSSGSIVFHTPLQFSATTTPSGIVEKSTILTASTSGNYTMTSANSFLTTINTPTASRNFILPAPSGLIAGQWFGICNKSTSFTIAVQYPSGTTIFTIPVASATGGGSSARFAVDSAGTAYFRCG
jgi:hypothetical protein